MKKIAVFIIVVLFFAIVSLSLFFNNWNWLVLLDAILIGVITSLIGSVAFLMVLWLFKPRIRISKDIAHFNHKKAGEVWAIKIINPSKIFSLHNVSISLYSISEYGVLGGKNGHLTKIDLLKERIEFIPRIKPKEKDNEAAYARLLFTNEDLNKIFDDDESLIFHVYAKHELSGFSKVFQKRYYSKAVIKNGKFAHGNDFSVH